MEQKTKQNNEPFVSRDLISKDLERLLQDENENRTAKSFISSFNPAYLVECPRRLFYKTTFQYISPVTYFEKKTQTVLIEKWLDYLAKCKKIRIINKYLFASDSIYNLHGYLPAVVEFKDLIAGVQIKGVNNKKFSKVKKKGVIKRDAIELMIYIWLLEISDGLLIYENLDNQDYLILHIESYKPIIKSVKKKCLEVINCQQKGEAPLKPYKNKAMECKECEFLNKCWRNRE